ncbi:hypothetical protein STEG23_016037 [Scotinomys teguina]
MRTPWASFGDCRKSECLVEGPLFLPSIEPLEAHPRTDQIPNADYMNTNINLCFDLQELRTIHYICCKQTGIFDSEVGQTLDAAAATAEIKVAAATATTAAAATTTTTAAATTVGTAAATHISSSNSSCNNRNSSNTGSNKQQQQQQQQ